MADQTARRIAPHIRRTPILHATGPELGAPCEVALKLELLQHAGSFKPRGAFNRLLSADLPPAGVIAASGTLAQIIPPSLVLIVLADQMGASVGDFYEGALIPGLSLAFLYGVWVAVVSIVTLPIDLSTSSLSSAWSTP